MSFVPTISNTNRQEVLSWASKEYARGLLSGPEGIVGISESGGHSIDVGQVISNDRVKSEALVSQQENIQTFDIIVLNDSNTLEESWRFTIVFFEGVKIYISISDEKIYHHVEFNRDLNVVSQRLVCVYQRMPYTFVRLVIIGTVFAFLIVFFTAMFRVLEK